MCESKDCFVTLLYVMNCAGQIRLVRVRSRVCVQSCSSLSHSRFLGAGLWCRTEHEKNAIDVRGDVVSEDSGPLLLKSPLSDWTAVLEA